jgi:hypothetical protein
MTTFESLHNYSAHINGKFPGHVVTTEPIEVPKGETKPFEISVNGKLVWSMLEEVEGQPLVDGKRKPLLLEDNKWWGSANPDHLSYLDTCL